MTTQEQIDQINVKLNQHEIVISQITKTLKDILDIQKTATKKTQNRLNTLPPENINPHQNNSFFDGFTLTVLAVLVLSLIAIAIFL